MSSIVVIHPGSVGDTILALPVLAALKSHRSSSLHVLGHPGLVDVLPGRSPVDAMTSIEAPEYRGLLSLPEIPPAVGKFFQQCELVVAWTADRDGSIKAALQSLNRSHVVCSPGLFEKSDLHATDRFRATLTDYLPDEILPEVKLAATETDQKAGAQWLSEHGINVETDYLVAVHAGSGSPIKCWSSERFALVVDGLQEKGIRVVLIEGPADRTVTQAVTSRISIAPPRLRDASLLSVVGVLSQCDAFLGNDSGLTHIAATLGLPTVAVFGPTDPAIWGSRRSNLIALRAHSGCRCLTRDAQAACCDRVCFGSNPEMVLNILQRLRETVAARLAS